MRETSIRCKSKKGTKRLKEFDCSSMRETSIREYGSTLYVGLARAVSPTDTNRLTFFTNPTSGGSL